MKPLWALVLFLSFGVTWHCPRAEVVMTASVDSTDYVLREPVKIDMEIANDTRDTVRIFPVKDLGNHMRYMFIEVTRPDGAVEWRKFLVVSYTAVRLAGFRGEPLPPGTRVNWSLYPYMTYLVGPSADARREKGLRFAFGAPGTYRFRVAYCVDSGRHFLWKPEGGVLYSNSVEIRVREPTGEEKAILDAAWSGDRFLVACGDQMTHLKCDEEMLRSVIERYPQSPLTRYARFNLARTLAYSSDTTRAGEGIELLEELARALPGFRPEEIQFHRANALELSGRTTEAGEVYDEALKRFPALVDNFAFMSRKFWAETHDADSYKEYLKQRSTGSLARPIRNGSQQ